MSLGTSENSAIQKLSIIIIIINKPFGTNESGETIEPDLKRIPFLHSRTVQMAQRIGFNLSIPNTDYLKWMNCIRQPMNARCLDSNEGNAGRHKG